MASRQGGVYVAVRDNPLCDIPRNVLAGGEGGGVHAFGGTRGGGGGGGGGGVKEKNARAAVMMFRERQQQQHEDEVVNGGEENEVLYRMNANGEYGLGESASRRQELDMNRRLGSGRATSTRGFGFDNVKSSVFESIRFAPAASKTRAGAAGGNSMMMTQYAVNKAAAPGAARVYGGAMPAGRAHARLGSAMDEEPHATGGGGGTSHLMFNAGAQEAVFDLRNRLGGDGTLYHAQYQPRRHGRAAARRGGSGRTTSSRTFTLNVEDMHRRVRQERAKKITTTQNVRAVRFEEELRFNENDDDDDNNNIYEAADGMHAGVDNGSLTHNADMALSPIDGTQAFETGAPVPVSVHKTPDTVGMAALLVGLGDVEALQPDNDEAAAANDTPITPAVQLAYDDEAQDDMPAPVNDDDDDDDDAVNDDFGGFDNDVYDDDVEAAVVVPDKPKAPRVKKTPNRRLKKDFASRKSLAGHGIKLDVDTGVRRSTRTRMRPLEYWRNEKKSYGRSHNSLPTVKTVDLASPNPEWPMPKTRSKTKKKTTTKAPVRKKKALPVEAAPSAAPIEEDSETEDERIDAGHDDENAHEETHDDEEKNDTLVNTDKDTHE